MKSVKLSIALFTLLTSLAVQSAHIVTVRTELILKESQAGQDIQKEVEREQKKLSAPFEKIEAKLKEQEAALIEKQKALAKEDEKFKTEAALLSPEARADKYDELQKKHRDLDEELADFQRAMRKAHEDAKKVDQKLEIFYRKKMMAFEQEVKALIEEVAKAEGWDIVIPREVVVYASKATDKTDIVIKKMDDKTEKEKAAKKAVKQNIN